MNYQIEKSVSLANPLCGFLDVVYFIATLKATDLCICKRKAPSLKTGMWQYLQNYIDFGKRLKMFDSFSLFIKKEGQINSILTHFLTYFNLRFSDVFRGYRSGTLVENGSVVLKGILYW